MLSSFDGRIDDVDVTKFNPLPDGFYEENYIVNYSNFRTSSFRRRIWIPNVDYVSDLIFIGKGYNSNSDSSFRVFIASLNMYADIPSRKVADVITNLNLKNDRAECVKFNFTRHGCFNNLNIKV